MLLINVSGYYFLKYSFIWLCWFLVVAWGTFHLCCSMWDFLCGMRDLWSLGFPDTSVGKESACNAGDPSSFPGLGRSPGEGIGYTLQYSWASLVAQLVKNPSAMWEAFPIPGLQRSPGEGRGYPLQCSGLENSMDCIVHGVAKRQTWLSNFNFLLIMAWDLLVVACGI